MRKKNNDVFDIKNEDTENENKSNVTVKNICKHTIVLVSGVKGGFKLNAGETVSIDKNVYIELSKNFAKHIELVETIK